VGSMVRALDDGDLATEMELIVSRIYSICSLIRSMTLVWAG
jgi:hypothetical protein